MRKTIVLLLCSFLLMGQAPIEKTAVEVRLKRLEDEIELRRKQIKTRQILMPLTGKIRFGDGDTFIFEQIDDRIDIGLGTSGNVQYYFHNDRFISIGDGAKNLGLSTLHDWGTIYYHTLSQDSGKDKKQKIKKVSTDTFKADWLPAPQTYERKTSTGVIEYGLIAEDCPEEVIFREDGEIAGIKTNALIAYMIGVLKEMDKELKNKKDK